MPVTFGMAQPKAFERNPWNPNRMGPFEYDKLMESMLRFGFTDPITVRPLNGHYQIIDGEHRLNAAADVGIDDIPYFNVGDIPDTEAQALGIILNELHGRHDPKKLGSLLDELLSVGKPEEMLAGMPFTPEALAGMISLADFDWSAVGKLELTESPDPSKSSSKKGTTWVERTFRLPHEVNDVLVQALDKAKDGDEIEDWQALERVAADYLAS